MKRIRTLTLIALLLISLFMAVVPALAVSELVAINYSFMGDKNFDNIPDKWIVKGAAFRDCTLAYLTDACGMIFPPSNKGAAVYQHLPADIAIEVVEEGYPTTAALAIIGAKQFDAFRGYAGMRAHFGDTTVVVYNVVPSGNYPFTFHQFWGEAPNWVAGMSTDDVTFGMLVFPGDGYLAVDYMYPPFTPGP